MEFFRRPQSTGRSEQTGPPVSPAAPESTLCLDDDVGGLPQNGFCPFRDSTNYRTCLTTIYRSCNITQPTFDACPWMTSAPINQLTPQKGVFFGSMDSDKAYWEVDGKRFVLVGDQFQSLLEAVLPDARERARIKSVGSPREIRAVEKKIREELADEESDDPTSFHKKYVFRKSYGVESKNLLRCYVSAHFSIYGRAELFGDNVDDCQDIAWEELMGTVATAPACLTLFGPKPSLFRSHQAIGRLWFDADQLSSVVGTVDNFYFTTPNLSIRLKGDGISISDMGYVRSDMDFDIRLRLEERLSFIIECVAMKLYGEAKRRLNGLIKLINVNAGKLDGIEPHIQSLIKARTAIESGQIIRAAGLLAGVSRHLWQSIR